jgi:hypothetical protein
VTSKTYPVHRKQVLPGLLIANRLLTTDQASGGFNAGVQTVNLKTCWTELRLLGICLTFT